MSKVLVTGGAGFIGSHLVDELVKLGYQVVVIDSLSRGLLSNISKHMTQERLLFMIQIFDIVTQLILQWKVWIMFFIWQLQILIVQSVYPEESFDINFRGSQVVFKSALENGVKKVIFASSASVYGDPKTLPMNEGELNPITPYCVSKLASEHLLRFYNRSGLKSISFRNFNVYGERQNTDAYYTTVIIKFI